MFAAHSRFNGAATRYQDVDIAARVHGASPHGLVSILFEELQKAIETLAAAERLGGTTRPHSVQARAVAILHSLEASLDFERGGEIAKNLARIYREARRLLAVSGAGRPAAIEQARAMIGDIAGAWDSIAWVSAQ